MYMYVYMHVCVYTYIYMEAGAVLSSKCIGNWATRVLPCWLSNPAPAKLLAGFAKPSAA